MFPPETSADAVWQQNLALHRLVDERTERMRSTEHLLRSVINSLDGHMCIVARDGPILGEMAKDVEPVVRAVIESGTADQSVKRRVISDGEPRWMIVRVHPVQDS